ncbi:MAG: hypothetical protein ACJAXL_000636 [Alphaproteobacteria bacterium]|jgi:hypothetical protein
MFLKARKIRKMKIPERKPCNIPIIIISLGILLPNNTFADVVRP